MRRFACCLVALGLALPGQAASLTWDESKFDTDFDEAQKPWAEIQAQLPPAPKADTLRPFTVDAVSANRYFIDQASLSVGTDGVVRYTVLIRSPAGAETVNYEGMRCETSERKIYAFGRADGSWAKNRYARWERFSRNLQASYHRELFNSYFCAGGEGLAPLKTIIRRLNSGGYQGG